MTRQNAVPSETNNNNNTKESSESENGIDATKEANVETPALIPLWDLANHVDGVVTTSYNIGDGQIEGATLSDIKKDDQIFIHYGNRNNANLLVHNGYELICALRPQKSILFQFFLYNQAEFEILS